MRLDDRPARKTGGVCEEETMALIKVDFVSSTLMRTVPIQVVLPVDKLPFPGRPVREEKPFKTLYLLHGILGNCTDWVSGTRIQRWAEERDLAVVMPSGDNAFYTDHPESYNLYGEFIGRELVEVTRKMFPLSRKREDTYISGLSMGGYGSLRNGLKYHETFGAIAALSSALITDGAPDAKPEAPFPNSREYMEYCFGNLAKLAGGDRDPKGLVKMLKEKMKTDPTASFPEIYMACGVSDFLIAANRDLHAFLETEGVKHEYVEGPGAHEWDFWDTYIRKVLDWLPLEGAEAGRNSGNVL